MKTNTAYKYLARLPGCILFVAETTMKLFHLSSVFSIKFSGHWN